MFLLYGYIAARKQHRHRRLVRGNAAREDDELQKHLCLACDGSFAVMFAIY